MVLRIANIAGSILNVPGNGDAAPCPSLWSFGVEPEPALVLLGWMVHYSCLLISQSICGGWADVCELGRSLSPGVIQNGVMVLNRLVVLLNRLVVC